MKYLKTYKLFESNWYEMRDHINVLSDMSLQLWDKEFNVQVSDEIISREHQCIVVNIIKKGDMSNRVMNRFTFPVIKEELLEMVDYMDSEGWEVLNIEFNDLSSGYFYCYLEGDKLLALHTDREITEKFDQLIVKFVEKKEVKTNESFGQNIECLKVLNDICLELSDEDYSFFIQDLKGTGVINPDRISVSVAGKPNEGDEWRYRPFNYDDVRDVFERMIEYMNSEDFEILRFVYSTPENPADHNFLEYKNGELMTYNREKVDRFHHLQIIFTEKEVKTNESTEEDIHRELMIKKYGVQEIEECDEVIRNISSVGINEDVNVDRGNLQRLKDRFSDESGEDVSQIFDDNFIQTISDMCLELDDLGYDIRIYFPQYQKEGVDKILPSCCIDIDSEVGHFLNNKALEMTIREIQSYVSEFDLNVDIELGSDDLFVTADEFINQYNVEELDVISILIY